ncbi:hypothetical protein HDU87_007659 [Geranomyces variabilis]|uniref:ARM repeat-containing protein n=1 Tax=Geranomyces variabilis TaxID=109894 RepID=A0AAD5TDX5_9FUNG|nr:hypothetical protein HDU87_007659 [Geranomyces variabilis]
MSASASNIQKGLWLEKAQVKTWLSDLATRANAQLQERTAAQLLQLLRPPANVSAVPDDFEIRKVEVMKILLLLRADLHAESVLEASILLVACFARGTGRGATARMLALTTAEVHDRLVRIAADSGVGPGPRAAALRFLAETAAGGGREAAEAFCGLPKPVDPKALAPATAASEAIRALSEPDGAAPGVLFWALEGITDVSTHPLLRAVLLENNVLPALGTFAAHVCNDEYLKRLTIVDSEYYIPRLYQSTARLIKHMTAHAQDNKKFLVVKGAHAAMKWVLKRPEMDDVKLEALHAFANLVIEPSSTLDSAIPTILPYLAHPSAPHVEAALRSIRNVLVLGGPAAQTVVLTHDGIALIIRHLSSTNAETQLHALVSTQTLSVLPNSRAPIATASISVLLSLLNPEFPVGQRVVEHAMGILTNLALTDTVAQVIGESGGEALIARVFHFLTTADPTVPLSLLRNLCIDSPTCLAITSVGSARLFSLMFTTRSAEVRRDAMSVVRNLILQNAYCRAQFWKVAGFLDELIVDVTAHERELQLYAVEIVWCYVASSPQRARVFADMDAMNALLLPIEREPETPLGQLAGRCFAAIKEAAASVDVWAGILAEWQEADKMLVEERKRRRRAKSSAKRQTSRHGRKTVAGKKHEKRQTSAVHVP